MAKVHSLTFVIIILFITLSFGIVVSLESLSHTAGIIGVLSALFFAFMSYRKKLLNTGFTAFGDLYRHEMDDFKKEVFRSVNDLRKIMNQNEENHKKTLKHIVDLNLETQKQVIEQIGACKLIQGRKDVMTKTERDWKTKMEAKTGRIFDDVEEMKETISYIKGIINGKR